VVCRRSPYFQLIFLAGEKKKGDARFSVTESRATRKSSRVDEGGGSVHSMVTDQRNMNRKERNEPIRYEKNHKDRSARAEAWEKIVFRRRDPLWKKGEKAEVAHSWPVCQKIEGSKKVIGGNE